MHPCQIVWSMWWSCAWILGIDDRCCWYQLHRSCRSSEWILVRQGVPLSLSKWACPRLPRPPWPLRSRSQSRRPWSRRRGSLSSASFWRGGTAGAAASGTLRGNWEPSALLLNVSLISFSSFCQRQIARSGKLPSNWPRSLISGCVRSLQSSRLWLSRLQVSQWSDPGPCRTWTVSLCLRRTGWKWNHSCVDSASLTSPSDVWVPLPSSIADVKKEFSICLE